MGDFVPWLVGIGFGAFVIVPLVCAHSFEKRRQAEKESIGARKLYGCPPRRSYLGEVHAHASWLGR